MPARIDLGPNAEAFWARVEKGPVCWLWTGTRSVHGYGWSLRHWPGGGKAHRCSWILRNGPIPDGLWVLHKCDVRLCVNPDHLYLGTHADNQADKNRKGRNKHNGLKHEHHWNAKIGPIEVSLIRDLYAGTPLKQKDLAAVFGVTFGTISDIVLGKTWKPEVAPCR
jgi:hypothetical protein